MVPHRFFAENCVPQLGLVLTDGLKTANMLYPCMRKRVLLVVREKTIHSNDFQELAPFSVVRVAIAAEIQPRQSSPPPTEVLKL
ncbi:MAG: hypothetical protein DMG69_05660 [Acidobacteria bacterium]|nr:MAG: hypothetical protein DMG69_05660 [Acidobacteriota bacterium]